MKKDASRERLQEDSVFDKGGALKRVGRDCVASFDHGKERIANQVGLLC